MTRLLTMEHVHIGWFDDGGALKRRLRAAGIPVSQDLSVNAQPENLDPADLTYALASSSRAGAEALARQLLREGARCAVITMGEEGSLALRGTEFLILPAEPIAVIDTTGAGDSFIAGFLSVAAAGGELDRALAAGRNSASQACLHQGGFPQ
jgi:fructoselysine 6-kinase